MGVSDEQTFAYHLQMAAPEYNVRLFAVSGYGLTQNYARLAQMRQKIKPQDIVLIAYADYFDERNVATPSGLKLLDEGMKDRRARSQMS